MKKLFKTLITVITVVCMLSSMTALAATQTTVTKYGSDTNVNVVTTVSGVDADAIVTYLVSKDANSNGTADADEIKYINQATSTGADIEFSYAITGEGWSDGVAIADVKFGSDNADVAQALKANPEMVVYDSIDFIVKDGEGNAVEEAAEISYEKIGKGDEYTDVVIGALPGYSITSIKIGGVLVNETLAAHTVAYGQAVEVTVAPITETTVYLFKQASTTDGVEIVDVKTDTILNVVSGVAFYAGGPVTTAQIKFANGETPVDIDGSHNDGLYDAAIGGGNAGYFAVQLASAESLDGVEAVDAVVVKDGAPVHATIVDPQAE